MSLKKTDLAKGFATGSPSASLARRQRSFIDSGKAGHAPRLRRDAGPEMERVGSVYLPKTLATELRVRCAQRRQSLSDAVTEAVTLWLSEVKAL